MFVKGSTIRRRLAVGAISTAAILIGVSVPAQSSQAAQIIPGIYSVSVTPTTAVAGSSVTYQVTFSNASLPESLDVMNTASISFPAGYTNISAPSSVNDSQSLPWSVSTSGTTVSLSAVLLGVLPGGSVSVPVTATAPSAAGTYTGSSNAGGLVGGATGTNPFTIDGQQPSTTVTPAVPSKLVFVQQPSNTKTGSAITPAITVAATDSYGNVATTYNTAVSLSVAFNPNTQSASNPSGNLPQTATPVNGVATFSNVVINQSGDNYKLGASSGSLTPATSNAFREDTFVGACPANTTCTSPTLSGNGTTAKVTDERGSNNDIYTLALDNPGPDRCSSTVSGNESTFTNQDMTRYLTVTMTLSSSKRSSGTYGICFANKTPFTTKSGAPATLGSDGLYHGYLAKCSTNGNTLPCLVSLTETCYGGDLTAVFRSPPGDPKGMFGIIVGGAGT